MSQVSNHSLQIITGDPPGLVNHSLQIITGDPPGLVNHSLQIIYDPSYIPNTLTVVNGSTVTGNLSSIQSLDSTELIIQETATTPGLNIVFTYSGVHAANPKIVHFTAYYEGDPSHVIKLQIKKNDQTWEDVVGALFPTTSSMKSYNWNLPVPITDYVYDTVLSLRAVQEGSGSTSRKFHVDFNYVADKNANHGSGLKLVRSLSI